MHLTCLGYLYRLEIFLEAGYTIVSGVNFFGSTGSVLDVWYHQLKEGKKLTVTDKRCVRYFVDINDVVNLIFSSFGKNQIVFCKSVYKVELGDLLSVFTEVMDYHNYEELGLLKGEKLEEEIPEEITIIDSDKKTIKRLIQKWRREPDIHR